MNRATRRIVVQPTQLQRLRDEALSCKGGVPVKEEWHHTPCRVGPGVAASGEAVLLRTGASKNNRIDRLEM